MCGVTGLVGVDASRERDALERMTLAVAHRGPDDAGIWCPEGGTVAFGHRRLSIIDLRHGHQPMISADGRIVVAYNGEIYNHRRLRAELQTHGHEFRTQSDTEVLLVAYQQWGIDCLSRLDGMFAFLLWDDRDRRLFLARDRAGEKPLYFTRLGGGWAFASEIKSLLAHPRISPSVDRQALTHFLSFLTTPAPDTLFEGIHKIPAGHFATWTKESGLDVRSWWRVDPSATSDIGPDEAAGQLRSLLSDSIADRMMSDVPFGVYLSGGVDSSTNVALMAQQVSEPIRTFSVAFADEPSLDELGHARRVSEMFGTAHTEIVLDDSAVLSSLPELIHHQDEPIADPVCVPLLHLAHATKEHGVTVVQVGEGSDELFFGYGGYAQVLQGARRLRIARSVIPPIALASALRIASRMSPLKREFMLESVLHGVPPAHGVAGLSEQEKRELLIEPGEVTAHDFLRTFGSGRTPKEIAAATLRHELALRLPELLLMRVDKMTMAASVEARTPFLAPALIEFAASLPLDIRYRGNETKWVLKRAMEGELPHDLLYRRKQGFGAPVWRWSDSLRPIAEEALFRPEIAELLDLEVVRRIVDRPASTRQGFELWTLLNFALWHRHWIEGQDLRDDPRFTPSSPTP